MDKQYSDNDVRGQRSILTDNDKNAVKELIFTENAKKHYEILTGSQKTFINRELDDLKLGKDSFKSREVNSELNQRIIYKEEGNQIIITDFLFDAYRGTEQYKKSQIRMNNMNN